MTIPPERIAVIVLAAGRSSRFGPADKIAAMLNGLPLGLHICRTVSTLAFARKIAVTGTQATDFETFGFETLVNTHPERGQSWSLGLGIAALCDSPVDAALICLADMPFISRSHIEALLARFDGDRIATQADDHLSPPAIFGRQHFPALLGLHGDRGAGSLLIGAPALAAPSQSLMDIDTTEHLKTAHLTLRDT